MIAGPGPEHRPTIYVYEGQPEHQPGGGGGPVSAHGQRYGLRRHAAAESHQRQLDRFRSRAWIRRCETRKAPRSSKWPRRASPCSPHPATSARFADYNAATPTILTQPAVDFPASDPNVTGVGGTTLQYLKPTVATTVGTVTKPATNGTYVAETVWKSGSQTSVGGPLRQRRRQQRDFFQAGLTRAAWAPRPLRRDVPDVALNADPNSGYDIFLVGKAVTTGGTERRRPAVGRLHRSGQSAAYFERPDNDAGVCQPTPVCDWPQPELLSTTFHDITTGDNLYFSRRNGL